MYVLALAMRHGLKGIIYLRAQDLRKGVEQPAYTPLSGIALFPYLLTYLLTM